MKTTNYNKMSASFWNRLNYRQKVKLYSLVNNVVLCPKEKFLNYWWFSLSIYRRDEIVSDLMEFANVK